MTRSDSAAVRTAVQLYRFLLAAYPPAFRDTYGSLMLQVFRDCCRSAARQGSPAALVQVCLLTFGDYLISLAREHAHGGAQMSRSLFTTLTGWGLPLGFLCLLAGDYASDRPSYNAYNATIQPMDRFLNTDTSQYLIWAAFILYALGMTGLFLHFIPKAAQMSNPGMARTALLLGLVGGWATLILPWFVGAFSDDWAWFTIMICYGIMVAGAGLFAIEALRSGLLSLPLGLGAASGLIYPILLAFFSLWFALTGTELSLGSPWDDLIMVILPGLALTALGLAQVRQPSMATA